MTISYPTMPIWIKAHTAANEARLKVVHLIPGGAGFYDRRNAVEQIAFSRLEQLAR